MRLSYQDPCREDSPRVYLYNVSLTRQHRASIDAELVLITSGGKEISLEEWKDYNYRVEAPTRVEAEPDTPSPPLAEMWDLYQWGKEQTERTKKGPPFIQWLQRDPIFVPGYLANGEWFRKGNEWIPVTEANDIIVPIYCCKEINPLADDAANWEDLIRCPDCREGRISISRDFDPSRPGAYDCVSRSSEGCGSLFFDAQDRPG